MASKDLSFILLGEDKSASRVMGEAATNAEKATGRIGGAFTKVGGLIGGEFGEVLGKVGEGIQQVGEKSGKMSSTLMVGGGVVTGMGVALNLLGSGHKQAADQLEQAVKNSGKSFEEFKGQFDKVIAKQQGYGRSTIDTSEALRKLTTSTNDPKKAIAEMGLVSDLAAAKHISLSEAADLVSKILMGKGAKALTQFGIVLGAHSNSIKDVASAQTALGKAETVREAAVLKLNQLEEIQHAKKTLSVSDHIALQNAQIKVNASTEAMTAAQTRLADAQEKAKTKTNSIQDSVDSLSKKLDGQANKSVDNFGAQINIARVRLTDWGASMGEKVGPVLTALGPMLMIVGVAMDLFRAKQMATAAATAAGTVATEGSSIATKAAAAAHFVFGGALYASTAAMVANKMETLAIIGLYAKDMVVGVAKAVAGFAISTAAIIGNTVASVAGRVAIIAGTVAMGVATAAQWAFNIALNANPISLIIIAIAALVAGLIYFFTQTKLGKEVWANVVTFIGTAWNWLWNSVIKPVGEFIGASFRAIGSTASAVFGAIGSIIGGVFSTATSIVRGAINIMIDLINGIIKNINGIGGAIKSATGGAIDIKLGTIPRLATGGVTNGPMLAVIGDNPGGREIVQPLSMYKADLAKERAAGAQTSGSKAAQGGFYIDKFITQAGQSPQEIAANLGWMGRWAT